MCVRGYGVVVGKENCSVELEAFKKTEFFLHKMVKLSQAQTVYGVRAGIRCERTKGERNRCEQRQKFVRYCIPTYREITKPKNSPNRMPSSKTFGIQTVTALAVTRRVSFFDGMLLPNVVLRRVARLLNLEGDLGGF